MLPLGNKKATGRPLPAANSRKRIVAESPSCRCFSRSDCEIAKQPQTAAMHPGFSQSGNRGSNPRSGIRQKPRKCGVFNGRTRRDLTFCPRSRARSLRQRALRDRVQTAAHDKALRVELAASRWSRPAASRARWMLSAKRARAANGRGVLDRDPAIIGSRQGSDGTAVARRLRSAVGCLIGSARLPPTIPARRSRIQGAIPGQRQDRPGETSRPPASLSAVSTRGIRCPRSSRADLGTVDRGAEAQLLLGDVGSLAAPGQVLAEADLHLRRGRPCGRGARVQSRPLYHLHQSLQRRRSRAPRRAGRTNSARHSKRPAQTSLRTARSTF